ncbi:MAG: hypothetical protein CMJ32_05470 [Phycisphaerae bacterium]|nr:hypothetical protein [Phycisphaerae bacterium]
MVGAPAFTGFVIVACAWRMRAIRNWGTWISGCGLVACFVMSMVLVSGFPWPPIDAWKYVGLVLLIQLLLALPMVRWPKSIALGALGVLLVSAVPALVLGIPGVGSMGWRIVMFVFLLVMILVTMPVAQRKGLSVPLSLWMPCSGLSVLLLLSGFAIAALITGAVAAFLGGMAVIGLVNGNYVIGRAGMFLVVSTLMMMSLVGYGYDYDSFPAWAWLIIPIAPVGLLAGELVPPSRRTRAAWLRIIAVLVITGAAIAVAMSPSGSVDTLEEEVDLDLYMMDTEHDVFDGEGTTTA